MRNILNISLKLVWGAFLLLTSVYCLLAFLPYTYYAFVKAPAYEWMPWFVGYYAILYWVCLAFAAISQRKILMRSSRWPVFVLLAINGSYITARPFMPALHNDWNAYGWALAALVVLVVFSALDVIHHWPRVENSDQPSLDCWNAVFVAAGVALLYAAGVQVRSYVELDPTGFHMGDTQLVLWSVLSHVLVAVLAISVLNLIRKVASQTVRARSVSVALIAGFSFAALYLLVARFLNNSLSFEGWAAQIYAASLALVLTLFGLSLVLPWFGPTYEAASRASAGPKRRMIPKIVGAAAVLTFAAIGLALPSLLSGKDWNGIIARICTLLLWFGLTVCAYVLRPRRKEISLPALIAIPLLSVVLYKTAEGTAIFWAKPLGSTDDEIARTLEAYGARDASFELAHNFLGNSREQQCGDLCRILRQHSNIRNAEIGFEVNLVDDLKPTVLPRPNIFIFVIDSLRPDYLGAYNPRVDFTPNLDGLAKESAVLRNAYTQYAGTTLSEPAIWSGAMLLHAHYMQPFARVNSLEKLARADNYQMIVSFDTVLRELLSPSDDMIRLDTQLPMWNRFEICSTVRQAASALDRRPNKSRPIFFYAQPMNVHHFAINDLPKITNTTWRRPGFNQRIAWEVQQVDACLGEFFKQLKSRGLYDNSIIVLTSDHGDGSGEGGRYSHSTTIFPEIMRVPIIVRLPQTVRKEVVYDESRVTTLTDIAPSLYYLLGHRPIRRHAIFGCPIFAKNAKELESCQHQELLLASDVRAVFGILAEKGRFLYATYDSPGESFLFDLINDPRGEHNILTPELKRKYDERIISQLQAIADFYGYRPGLGSLIALRH